LSRLDLTAQSDLLGAEGVHRYVWEGRFGSMLIEARGDQVSFNGTLRESVDAAAWPNYRAA